MLFSLVTFPSGADLYTGISDYSGATFDNFLPIMLFAVGLIIGGMVLAFVIGMFRHGAEMFFEKLMGKFGMGDYRGGVQVSEHTSPGGFTTTDRREWIEKNY